MSISDIEIDLTVMSSQSKKRMLDMVESYAATWDARTDSIGSALGLFNETFPIMEDLPAEILGLSHKLLGCQEGAALRASQYVAAVDMLEIVTTAKDDKSLLDFLVYFPAGVGVRDVNLLERLQEIDSSVTMDQITLLGEPVGFRDEVRTIKALMKCKDNAQAMAFKLAL